MDPNVQALKHYIYELEYAISVEDNDRVKNVTRKIKEHVQSIENEIAVVTNQATGIYYKHINTIEFLYKPIDVDNPYKGDYLEKFSKERAYELTKSGAKEGHDEFWSQHNVLRANVFGIVPVEMISAESAKELIRSGWLSVNVEVLDFGNVHTDLKNIYTYCEESFDNYLTIKEEQTDSTVVLMFAS